MPSTTNPAQHSRVNISIRDDDERLPVVDVNFPSAQVLEGNASYAYSYDGDVMILANDDNVHTGMDSILMDEEARRHNAAIVHVQRRELSLCHFLWHRLWCKCILPVCVVTGATIGIMIACGYQFDKETLPPFLVTLIFDSRNGWDNVNIAEIPKWDTSKTITAQGDADSALLQLEVLNGLDDSWQSYLEQSIEDWNTGEPDVLELSVTKLARSNSDCDFERGKIMICNGDYGPTDFHGMNHLLVDGTTITASLAKLNEHYLKGASRARKQYTICHELGHAFGIPHADEKHYNINLGNCMDYTSRPWSNTAPDKHTFELLQKIYDPTENTGSLLPTTSTSTKTSLSATVPGMSGVAALVPDRVTARAQEATAYLESNFDRNKDDSTYEGWESLDSDENHAAFHMDLGDGYSLQTHFLLVSK